MEQEFIKAYTDCIYFLASPLTCKKGIECEYRHCDIARLNPRDCWYWLSGSCLNPSCAFRHPPLDGVHDASSESALLPSQPPEPVNKTNFPCYFYFNGFCNKGEKCSFVHLPDGAASTCKSLKTSSAVPNVLPAKSKKSVESELGTTLTEVRSTIPSQNVAIKAGEIKCGQRVDAQLPTSSLKARSASPQLTASGHEDDNGDKSDLSPSADDLMNSPVGRDQGTEEPAHVVSHETWTLSPGLDVVDNGLESRDYGVHRGYVVTFKREDREVTDRALKYRYESPDEYVPAYPDTCFSHEHERYDPYYSLAGTDYAQSIRHCAKELTSESILSRKRKTSPSRRSMSSRGQVDLRESLMVRSVVEELPVIHISKRLGNPPLNDRVQEESRRHVLDRMQRIAASEEKNNRGRRIGMRTNVSNGGNLHGWLKSSHRYRSVQNYRGGRQMNHSYATSEFSRRIVPKKKRNRHEPSAFTGPKTLDQIKEEKGKARKFGYNSAKLLQPSTDSFGDFQGPKPLSEILKGKRNHSLNDVESVIISSLD